MPDNTAGALVERAAARFGPEVAVAHGRRRITYHEQIRRIRRAGRALLALGLSAGDRVAILMEDRPELLDVYFGALWSGLAVVPLNARHVIADHQYFVCDSGARVLVHDAAHERRVSQIRGVSGVEFTVSVDEDAVLSGGFGWQWLTSQQPGFPGMPTVLPDDLYGIYYTLGTTGQPKGVVHTHRTVLAVVDSELAELGLGARDRFAHVTPLSRGGGGLVLPIWLRGGTNHLLGRFDAEVLAEAVVRERISATLLSPEMLPELVAATENAGPLPLRTVLYGGSPADPAEIIRAVDRFGPALVQIYGMTEVPNQISVLRKRDHAEAVATGHLAPLSSCGRPVAIADVRLLDPDGRWVPAGEPGEVVVRGPHVLTRYWNRRETTRKALRQGAFHSGEQASADEQGFLHLADRQRETIHSGGVTVYPRQVEASLIAHPQVREACVFGVPDAARGEVVTAVAVTDPAARLAADELIAWVAASTGPVRAPRTVEFVDAIPVTALGRHDKPALRLARSPHP